MYNDKIQNVYLVLSLMKTTNMYSSKIENYALLHILKASVDDSFITDLVEIYYKYIYLML